MFDVIQGVIIIEVTIKVIIGHIVGYMKAMVELRGEDCLLTILVFRVERKIANELSFPIRVERTHLTML